MIGFAALVVTSLFAAGADEAKAGPPDNLAIEQRIYLYADALDWDRADPEGGKAQFLSIFSDDVVARYPKWNMSFSGKGDEAGGIGWFYTNFNMATQSLSHTIISNIIITVKGKEATTKDRYSHIGYFIGKPQNRENATFQLGYHEGKWRKVKGQWECYQWDGYVEFDNTSDAP